MVLDHIEIENIEYNGLMSYTPTVKFEVSAIVGKPEILFSPFIDYRSLLLDELRGRNYHIKKVIFNNPATIILWTDGTKTVVRCQEGDTYDEEKGFMAAYLKKLLGNDNTFNKEIKKYCIEAYLPDYLKED